MERAGNKLDPLPVLMGARPSDSPFPFSAYWGCQKKGPRLWLHPTETHQSCREPELEKRGSSEAEGSPHPSASACVQCSFCVLFQTSSSKHDI